MERRQTPCLLLCCYSCFFITSWASPFPSSTRGVHPLDVEYYATEVIKCKDGSNSFTKDRLNDDFCDCVDGTDEPGTSACPSAKFYCRNLGSQPRFLFSSRVNDHICDCCDGSDEFDGVVYCPNTCIMGGNIKYTAEYSQATSANTIQAKESKQTGKLEDMIRTLKDLKILALIQLIVIVFWAIWFFCRHVKSRRRQYRL